MKYLGIIVGGRDQNIFGEEKKIWLHKAQVKYAQLISQIKKSYDKTTVGKVIWKQIMVTALLFVKAVVMAAKTTIKKVQTIENRVYRYLLGVAGYVAVAALRGEVGASRMETRVQWHSERMARHRRHQVNMLISY